MAAWTRKNGKNDKANLYSAQRTTTTEQVPGECKVQCVRSRSRCFSRLAAVSILGTPINASYTKATGTSVVYRGVLSVLILALSTPVFGDIVKGVLVPSVSTSAPAAEPGAIIAPPAGATVINFDDLTAPCLFVDSPGPLTSHYSSLGVNFSGPAQGSGGFILNECSNFGVTGHSAPNFLAFNTEIRLPNGGIPAGPETIVFADSVASVQINVGQTDAGTITLACFTGSSPAGTSTVIGKASLTTLSVSGPGITSCTLSFSGTALVADDLAFVVTSAEIPTMTEWGLLAFSVMLAVFGVLRLRLAWKGIAGRKEAYKSR